MRGPGECQERQVLGTENVDMSPEVGTGVVCVGVTALGGHEEEEEKTAWELLM